LACRTVVNQRAISLTAINRIDDIKCIAGDAVSVGAGGTVGYFLVARNTSSIGCPVGVVCHVESIEIGAVAAG
jgi:hypothetical protein